FYSSKNPRFIRRIKDLGDFLLFEQTQSLFEQKQGSLTILHLDKDFPNQTNRNLSRT
ncbi:hypothetical protein GIB67_025763, partial [Kingdonia uniflora]